MRRNHCTNDGRTGDKIAQYCGHNFRTSHLAPFSCGSLVPRYSALDGKVRKESRLGGVPKPTSTFISSFSRTTIIGESEKSTGAWYLCHIPLNWRYFHRLTWFMIPSYPTPDGNHVTFPSIQYRVSLIISVWNIEPNSFPRCVSSHPLRSL